MIIVEYKFDVGDIVVCNESWMSDEFTPSFLSPEMNKYLNRACEIIERAASAKGNIMYRLLNPDNSKDSYYWFPEEALKYNDKRLEQLSESKTPKFVRKFTLLLTIINSNLMANYERI